MVVNHFVDLPPEEILAAIDQWTGTASWCRHQTICQDMFRGYCLGGLIFALVSLDKVTIWGEGGAGTKQLNCYPALRIYEYPWQQHGCQAFVENSAHIVRIFWFHGLLLRVCVLYIGCHVFVGHNPKRDDLMACTYHAMRRSGCSHPFSHHLLVLLGRPKLMKPFPDTKVCWVSTQASQTRPYKIQYSQRFLGFQMFHDLFACWEPLYLAVLGLWMLACWRYFSLNPSLCINV